MKERVLRIPHHSSLEWKGTSLAAKDFADVIPPRNCPLWNLKETYGLSGFTSGQFLWGFDLSRKKLAVSVLSESQFRYAFRN